MTFLRKFFDAAPADAPAPAAPVNIAQLLASQGVRTDSDTPATVPDIKIEEPKAEQPKPSEQPNAETAPVKEEPKPEPPKAPENPAAPAPAAPAPTVQPPAPAADWKEVLKNHPDHAEVFKTLGYDDKMIGFFQRWKSGEDMKAYLEAATTDYSKWSAEDLMKRQLQRDYPELDPADFEELYRMKVIEQYKVDPDLFNEQEVRRGKIMLQADARKLRDQFTKEQQEYLLPKPPEVDPRIEQERQQAEQRQQEAQKQFEAYKQYITDHGITKDLMTNKSLVFGEGEEAFKYAVEQPNDLLDLVFDSNKISEKLFDEVDGKRVPNVFKHLAVAAILNNDSDLFNLLAKHYKKVGAKQIAEKIENPSAPGGIPSRDVHPSDPIAQLAKAGIITGGG